MAPLCARLALGLALLIAPVLSACSLVPCFEGRHESGLLLVCPERIGDMPEELKAAASFAWSLAEDHPDDFGYPWPDPETRTLEVRVTTAAGDAIARDWIANGAKRDQPKPGPDLPRPQVPVKLVTVDRSFRELTDIQHGVTFAKDLPDYDAIYETGGDTRRNVTVITIDRRSDRLLRALADKYGTEAIVIHVDPARPRIGY